MRPFARLFELGGSRAKSSSRPTAAEMDTWLIFNSNAGSAGENKPLFHRFANRSRLDFRPTASAGDAGRLAREAVQAGCRRIIAAGGDGTVTEVVNGIAPDFDRVELAILPLGTGNDLCRSLDIPGEDLAAAFDIAQSDNIRAIDVVRVTGGTDCYLINAASGGFGGEVAADIKSEDKQRWGSFAYWMTAAAKLADMQEHELHLELDGETIDEAAYGLSAANGRFVGGGFPIAAEALLDDGLLDLMVIPVDSMLELMSIGLDVLTGRKSNGNRMTRLQAKRLSVRAKPKMLFSIDGESKGAVDVNFEVLPQALRVVVGENPPAISSTE